MTKYAVIIPDGAADRPIPQLDNRTPLEAAETPNMDRLSSEGRLGMVRTVPVGLEAGSDVAQMSILGYDPRRYYCGRAPIEAAARNVPLGDNDWVFRCNLVTISDEKLVDHSAGHISTAEAVKLVGELNNDLAAACNCRFHTGVSYRHLAVFKDADFDVKTYPPHDNVDAPIDRILPQGNGCKKLIRLMDGSRQLFADHPINRIRMDLGENPASGIWLWGQGKRARLESFRDRYGLSGAAVAAVDLARGLARLAGFDFLEVPGATGFVDTNYAGKAEAAIGALADHDLVLVHIEAPDEASHSGRLDLKIKAIEMIDSMIVGPMLEALGRYESWRILVAPDHPTPVATRVHSADPVPFAMAGTGIDPVPGGRFSESVAAGRGLVVENGHELMEYFLRR